MRAVSRATWTSGEPVSLSPRLLSSMILLVSMDIWYCLVMRDLQNAVAAGNADADAPPGPPLAGRMLQVCLKKPANCSWPRPGSQAGNNRSSAPGQLRRPGEQAPGMHHPGRVQLPEAEHAAFAFIYRDRLDRAGGPGLGLRRVAAAEPDRLRGVQLDRRELGQPGPDWQQAVLQCGLAARFDNPLELLQGVHPRRPERVDPEPSQYHDVRAAAQRLAEVADKASDVGARAALHLQREPRPLALQQAQRVHHYLALRRFDRLAPARLGV